MLSQFVFVLKMRIKQAFRPHRHGMDSNLNGTVMSTVLLAPSDISSLFCSQQLTQSRTHQSSGTELQPLKDASWSCALWGDRGFEGTGSMKTRQRNREADLINADLLWEPWAFGCLEGRRRVGATTVQQRCQWSAEKAGVTSGLRLHDSTNACSSLCHGSATEGAHWLVLKETDRQFLDPRISHAVVNTADENRDRLTSCIGHLALRLVRTTHLCQSLVHCLQGLLRTTFLCQSHV